MKSILLVVLLAFFCNISLAQESPAPYRQAKGIPGFRLRTAPDSLEFTQQSLRKKTQTIFMVFSPDCDHCLHSTEDMLANVAKLKKVQIVMVTPAAFSAVKTFYKDFKLSEYPNIAVGSDNGFFLGSYFAVRNFPAIFLYDRNGKFKATFKTDEKWADIVKALR